MIPALLLAFMGPLHPAPQVTHWEKNKDYHRYEWKRDFAVMSLAAGIEVAVHDSVAYRYNDPLFRNRRAYYATKAVLVPMAMLLARAIHKHDATGAHKVKLAMIAFSGLAICGNLSVPHLNFFAHFASKYQQ